MRKLHTVPPHHLLAWVAAIIVGLLLLSYVPFIGALVGFVLKTLFETALRWVTDAVLLGLIAWYAYRRYIAPPTPLT